jgi:pyrrolidone-carboxylate peptidase
LILLTGFARYGNYKGNVSGLIVKNLEIKDFNIKKEILPVSWKLSINSYKNILNKLESKPKIVILLGIHSNKHYHLEKFSWNIAFGQDSGRHTKFGFIERNLRFYLKTPLNLRKLYSLLKNAIDIRISYFAGTYLCNFIYYWALLLSCNEYPTLFIHIPDNEKLSRGINFVIKIIRTIVHIL